MKTGQPVKVGDIVTDMRGLQHKVTYFRPPHKSSSQGHISVELNSDGDKPQFEYYVGVFNLKWEDLDE